MYLMKRKDGAYSPMDDNDYQASAKLAPGSVVKATVPRNYKFHKKAFALLQLGFDNQDKFESFEIYRKYQTILAGYFDEVPSKDGEAIPIPKSLAYDAMSAEDFEKWFNATLELIAKQMDTASEKVKAEIESFYN